LILADSWFLLLLLLVPPVVWAYKRGRGGSIRFPLVAVLKRVEPSLSARVRPYVLPGLRGFALGLMVLALVRPQKGDEFTKVTSEGVDIVLTLDVSGSMRAEDFTFGDEQANRLAVVKYVVEEFIKARKNDRIGMVVFASYAYTQCPLTTDHDVLLDILSRVDFAPAGEERTAIGSALASSLTLLQDSKAKSKVIVLLTDGKSNAGRIDPITAAKMAEPLGVKIYTVGVGTRGLAPVPQQTPYGIRYIHIPVDLDEDTLKEIARTTNGRYFRATDTESLEKVYKEIDRLEKTKVEVTHYAEYKELFHYLLVPALCILMLEILLAGTRFRRIP